MQSKQSAIQLNILEAKNEVNSIEFQNNTQNDSQTNLTINLEEKEIPPKDLPIERNLFHSLLQPDYPHHF